VFWRGIESLSLPFFSAIAFPDLLSYFVYLVLLAQRFNTTPEHKAMDAKIDKNGKNPLQKTVEK
jgi:hypothetical protein